MEVVCCQVSVNAMKADIDTAGEQLMATNGKLPSAAQHGPCSDPGPLLLLVHLPAPGVAGLKGYFVTCVAWVQGAGDPAVGRAGGHAGTAGVGHPGFHWSPWLPRADQTFGNTPCQCLHLRMLEFPIRWSS